MEQAEPRPDDEALAAFYQSQDYTAHEPVDDRAARRRAAIQLAAVRRAGGALAKARVLDLGCGGGQLLEEARAEGAEVTGVDLAAHAHAACRRKGIECVASLEALGERRFDGVVMSHVLEHVPDVLVQLEAVRRRVARDGWLCVEVPNRASLRAQASPRWMTTLGADERHRAFPAHLWYFTPATLSDALDRAGFTVALMTTSGLGAEALRPRWLATPGRQVGSAPTPAPPAVAAPASAPAAPESSAPVGRGLRARLRAELKRRFLDALLGESLLAVARSRRPE